MTTEAGGRWQGPALLTGTALVLVAGWALRAASTGGGEDGGFTMPPETVGVAVAAARPWQATATLLGTLAPIEAVTLRVEVGGRLTEVGFTSGAAVQRGEVLARLDAAVEQAELRAAEAELKALSLRRERLVAMVAERGASEMDRDQAVADEAAASARVQGLQARIRQKLVVAPFNGRAGLRNHHPGQVVDPGTVLTAVVSDTTAVYADLWVPTALLAGLSPGTALRLRVGDHAADGTIEVIEPLADAERRAVAVRARVETAPVGWLPGASVQADVPTGASAEHVVIPSIALQTSAVGTLVWRVAPGEHGEIVQAQPVTVLADLGGEVVLDGGLSVGDRFVTDGAFKLQEGSAIAPAGADGG